MSQKEFKPGVTIVNNTESELDKMAELEEREFSEEETQSQMRLNEEDLIQGLIDAAGYSKEEEKRIEIVRDKKVYFAFSVHPLCEDEYNRCKKKHTKYVRNKHLGMKLPEDTDSAKYRSALIYQATVEEDRKKLWDNKKVWEALRNKGLQIMNGLDVIEYSLKAGEKDKILEVIDEISGYDMDLEEVVKN